MMIHVSWELPRYTAGDTCHGYARFVMAIVVGFAGVGVGVVPIQLFVSL